ncbi:MAG: L,D-transpeptidase family protein [Actinomycetota bacterium]|nr:L,D-transpeptidase family protein [Actinomycetota bacterium]
MRRNLLLLLLVPILVVILVGTGVVLAGPPVALVGSFVGSLAKTLVAAPVSAGVNGVSSSDDEARQVDRIAPSAPAGAEVTEVATAARAAAKADAEADAEAAARARAKAKAQAEAAAKVRAAAKAEAAAEARAARAEQRREDREKVGIAAVQGRLAELKYYADSIDGVSGTATISAVMAFQKVNGLSADGVVGPLTRAALDQPVAPALQGGAATRVEVDLTKQVLYYVRNGQLERIMAVSSGSGESYETSSGGTATSLTPVGSYIVERKIPGIREAPLGSLYDPMYFYAGWAIHGSDSVPSYPASHGCVRVSRADALWLYAQLDIGTQVSLYGGTYTFSAGSGAAGTSAPAGDTGAAEVDS